MCSQDLQDMLRFRALDFRASGSRWFQLASFVCPPLTPTRGPPTPVFRLEETVGQFDFGRSILEPVISGRQKGFGFEGLKAVLGTSRPGLLPKEVCSGNCLELGAVGCAGPQALVTHPSSPSLPRTANNTSQLNSQPSTSQTPAVVKPKPDLAAYKLNPPPPPPPQGP